MSVKVKFGKDVLTIDTSDTSTGADFKRKLEALTKVPVAGQKIMPPLADTADMAALSGKQMMLIGTAATVAAPTEAVVFAEDVKDAAGHAAHVVMSNGLENLGNTCYLNSAVQTLRAIPELRNFLARSASVPAASALNGLFKQLEGTKDKVAPENFVRAFWRAFPQFAERSRETGQLMQHDSQEALGNLLQIIEGATTPGLSVPPSSPAGGAAPAAASASAAAGGAAAIQQDSSTPQDSTPLPPNCSGLLVGTMRDTIKTKETGDVKVEEQPFTMLRCEVPAEVNSIETGIERALKSQAWTNDAADPANLLHYSKTSEITGLPQYLFCHLVRFAWRPDTQKKAKVLKPISFPMVLDVANFCSSELKAALRPAQEAVRVYRDQVMEQRKNSKRKDADKAVNEDSQAGQPKIPPRAVSGLYELCAVISHKGRDADGGHYVAWVKKAGAWLVFDDDHVSQVSQDDIERLKGQGESHIAYMLLYRAFDPESGVPPLLM